MPGHDLRRQALHRERPAGEPNARPATEPTRSRQKSGSLCRLVAFRQLPSLCPSPGFKGFKMTEHFLPKCFRSLIEGIAKDLEGAVVTIAVHFFLSPG